MSKEAFLGFLVSGAAALALWIAMRWPSHAPSTLARAFLHVAVAMVVGTVLAPATAFAAGGAGALVAIFVVALPGFTYMFLAGIWLARAALETLPY